jgi:hypothetical protein
MKDKLNPEKAQEYHEVACLLCLDIDLLSDMIDTGMTGDKLLSQVKHLIAESKKIRTDAEHRSMRFDALTTLFSLIGAIPDTGVHEADKIKEQDNHNMLPSSNEKDVF